MRREGAAGASSPALLGATPLDAHHRVGSLNASSEWLHKLDAKRSCRKMARRALPMLMALWALILLGLTFTDYGWIPRPHKRLAVPEKNSALVGKRFLLKGPHVMCPAEVKYRVGTPVNETAGCRCDAGWEGDTCHTAMCAQPCEHGRCIKPSTCKCHGGWRGRLCDQPICDQGCHHGTCIAPNVCACERMWKGPSCSILCMHGEFQRSQTGADGRPMSPCVCQEGWHGKGCNEALCTRFGCVNGVCGEPDKCTCDPGWRGSDCADSALQPVAKDILRSVYFDKGEFGSVLVNQGTPDKSWKHMKDYLSWSPQDHHVDREVLRKLVPANDSLTGYDWRMAASKGTRGKPWKRCAVVGDQAGLLRTQLGIMIDRHDAVLRFNQAPTSGNQEHVGSKTTLRLINKKTAEQLFRRGSKVKGQKPRSGLGRGEPHLIWRPDSYHIYPKLRTCCPQSNVQLLRSDWVDVQVDAYKTVLSRLMNAGLIVSDDPPEAARYSEQFVDPTLFLDGLHRVPTSFIGITLMVQLCQQVNVFGFDPGFIRARTRAMGFLGDTYYDTQTLTAITATESEDEAIVYADQDPGGSLRPNRGKDATAFMPDGEPFPGGGGTFTKGALDQMMLQLMEMDGYITLCTSEHPEKCLDSVQHYDRHQR
mmetsp:Transcript_10902/g.27426  ORF Transcript_10902/g.27426 Transcript_10902/m.27426 type:complete len:648 (-) Transcript_10902:240-2183(-)